MFGFNPFASTPFNSIKRVVEPIIQWGKRGGINKHETVKKSKRAELQEHIQGILNEPEVIVEEMKEVLQPFVKNSSTFSINYSKLIKDTEAVERIMAKFKAIQDEQEDEATLLLLI